MTERLDMRSLRRHRWRHTLQTGVLMVALPALLGLIGFLLGGREGLVWVGLLGVTYILLGPRMAPELVLRRLGARELWGHHELSLLAQHLAERAGLPRAPRVFHLPSPAMNAFAMGDRNDPTVTVTTGLVQALDRRQLAGVLAHEISHIASDDLVLMGMSQTFARLTRTVAWIGLLLLWINVPLLVTAGAAIPWLAVAAMLLAPAASVLLNLALARTREFEADRSAARMTGDPAGLASALATLERVTRRTDLWSRLLFPYRPRPAQMPAWMRTHPNTRSRIERLLALIHDHRAAA